MGLITMENVERRYPKKRKHENSSRQVTFRYHIRSDGVLIEICKTAFTNLHGLQNHLGRIRNLQKQLKLGSTTPKQDQRDHGDPLEKWMEGADLSPRKVLNSFYRRWMGSKFWKTLHPPLPGFKLRPSNYIQMPWHLAHILYT